VVDTPEVDLEVLVGPPTGVTEHSVPRIESTEILVATYLTELIGDVIRAVCVVVIIPWTHSSYSPSVGGG